MKKLKAALALSSLFFAGTTWADVPAQIKQQVPGYYRVAVGEYEVTALFDGYNDLSPTLLQGLSPDAVRKLLAQQKIDAERMPTAFNAFLVNTGKHLVMIDSGGGHCVAETAGQLIGNMNASGYRPEQVDTIFLTHLHLDHVCGLSDADGNALFPNATVYVPQGRPITGSIRLKKRARQRMRKRISLSPGVRWHRIKPEDISKPLFRPLHPFLKSRRPMPLAIRPAAPFTVLLHRERPLTSLGT